MLHDPSPPHRSTPPGSLLEAARGHAVARPMATAFEICAEDGQRFSLSWDDLEEIVRDLTAQLHERAPSPGVILLDDAPAALVVPLLLACEAAGHVLALGNARWAEPQRRAWTHKVSPSLSLSQAACARFGGWASADAFRSALRTLEWEPHTPRLRSGLPDDALLILSTSGSTGTPRAVVLTRSGVVSNASQFKEMLGLRAGHTHLAAIPLWHAAGLHVLTLPMLYAGGTTILHPTFDPTRVLEDLPLATHTILIPTHWARLLEAGLDTTHTLSLHVAVSGGAPLTASLQSALLKQGLPLAQGYGLTEATAMVTLRLPGDIDPDPADIGVPGPATEVFVDAPRGQEGTLFVRGPQCMAGVLGEPLRAPTAWIDTGDVAALTDDGRLLLRGRRDYRIRTGGESVYPERVESVLSAAPGVAALLAYSLPDPLWGERVAVLVRPQPGTVVTLEHLQRFARGRLADFEIPRALRAVHHLPLLPNGKPDRQRILGDLEPWHQRKSQLQAAS